jgi:hypothetical protein
VDLLGRMLRAETSTREQVAELRALDEIIRGSPERLASDPTGRRKTCRS